MSGTNEGIMTITYITDSRVLAVPIAECNEQLVDLKNYDGILFGEPPETPLAAPHYTKMRATVLEKLRDAQKALPNGWVFRLYEGFRSLAVQKMLFEEEYARVAKRLPNAAHQTIFNEATHLASPVINLDGTKNIPPHNTGAAVDIEILAEDGSLVDMGMTAADWIRVHPDLCLTKSPCVSTAVQKNRDILLAVMHEVGFVNYPTEWWHFSYGDRYWAYISGKSHAIYGAAEDFLSSVS
ncbi:MAG: M15 family metallopeptidase [Legionellales bacterium]|nr:M15 family metallopeptidase [Legionellales bacterium]